ncbi:hypothetical protein BWQ96_04876 [Gracilariopsis chorda]|uniref:Transmembrane protein 230 n=1 Tax=Gracilariopsis chorda TaxID=448386 RepID=A0A2V3ITA7_9FLOR|nr:hypothetical protein BWQ96_04876 [Gracilariopsis chorda]|eukprot:PXF45356.1 hypothetical protein BWQ96_04876 [Gracilariopsis chorda]
MSRLSTTSQPESQHDPYRPDAIPSDLYDTSTSRYSDAQLFRTSAAGHTRTIFPWRTIFVTLFLFGFGISFLLTGILHFWDRDQPTSISFIAVGSIAFLPGTYLAFNLIQTYRGAPGFHLSQFAHWDDYRW